MTGCPLCEHPGCTGPVVTAGPAGVNVTLDPRCHLEPGFPPALHRLLDDYAWVPPVATVATR